MAPRGNILAGAACCATAGLVLNSGSEAFVEVAPQIALSNAAAHGQALRGSAAPAQQASSSSTTSSSVPTIAAGAIACCVAASAAASKRRQPRGAQKTAAAV